METYVDLEGLPLLFSAANAAGHLYLAVAVAENGFAETWLYVGISAERLNLVRSGAIDLHDAFAKAEDGFLLRVLISPRQTDLAPMVRPIQVCKVPGSMLPLPGERLDLRSELVEPGGDRSLSPETIDRRAWRRQINNDEICTNIRAAG